MSEAATETADTRPGGPPAPTIGIVGIGRVGRAMVHALDARGVQPLLYNRTVRHAAAAAEQYGCTVAQSPSALAATCDILFITATVETGDTLYEGAEGLLSGTGPGRTIVETSTLSPAFVRELSSRVQDRGADFAEASITGRPAELERARAYLLTGGEESVVARLAPFLDMFGSHAHAGATGNSAIMKLALMPILFGYSAAVAQALVLAEGAGLPADLAVELLMKSPIGTQFLAARADAFVAPSSFPPQGRLDAAPPILARAKAMDRGGGTAAPVVDAISAVYEQAAAAGYGGHDITALTDHLRGQRIARSDEPRPPSRQVR